MMREAYVLLSDLCINLALVDEAVGAVEGFKSFL